jgi:hypothetical protein
VRQRRSKIAIFLFIFVSRPSCCCRGRGYPRSEERSLIGLLSCRSCHPFLIRLSSGTTRIVLRITIKGIIEQCCAYPRA